MKLYLSLVFICFTAFSIAQHQDKVDFKDAEVTVSVDGTEKSLSGKVVYSIDILERLDSVFLDAKKMTFTSVRINGKKAKFLNNQKTISIYRKFKPGKTYQLSLTYKVKPKQALYFIGEGKEQQIWTQGQGKYTSHWLPSLDDMNEKVVFNISILANKNHKVIANGKLKQKQPDLNNTNRWDFDMKHPMSSYLLAFAIGDFSNKSITSTSGIPIKLYYAPKDSLNVEPTYRYSKQIFDFLETEIGVPYPWQNYKQIPVRDFLYGGMENTTATIFSDGYVIDSTAFIDKNYVNVNVHELAHQWFGDMVTEVDASHHWLQEGFATYYAYLAEREFFGEDYYYWKLYDTAKQLRKLSRENNGEALINPKASSLTFYDKGAWALHMLKEEVGEQAFKLGVKEYLLKHQFKNVTIEDFILEIEKASGKDLSAFKTLWLESTAFPFEIAKTHLRKANASLNDFFELQWELTSSKEKNEAIIKRFWEKNTSIKFKEAVIINYYKSFSQAFLKSILKEEELKVRQAIALKAESIPSALKTEFISLLTDESYVNIENALYKLWVFKPEDRTLYLDKTKNVIGLPNKNVRLLWLMLSVLTKDYEEVLKKQYLEELRSYTAPKYRWDIRQEAFNYLNDVFGLSDENLKDLAQACVHHSWQFKKYARTLLDKQLKDNKTKKRFSMLLPSLNKEEQRYIKSKLIVK